ncbi:MAG TPA: hypothetical protein PKD49_15180 [Hyphomicrobium sp.]|nr:hypothetical protein [Hyphomicrobium sp.]
MVSQLDDRSFDAGGPTDRLRDGAPGRNAKPLPAIPVIETGRDFPIATLNRFRSRADDLFDVATRRYPVRLLSMLDKVSRAWLVRHRNAHLREIDAVAHALGRPGAYFFSINYEWGCTCRVAPSQDAASARLIRVLDWLTPGLGRNLVGARVTGAPGGPFAILTWPGYSGVLQVMAPQRFSAALNQAPMQRSSGLYYLDWASSRRRVWGMGHPTPAHLLRDVSEHAETFAQARQMLCRTPVSAPAIFSIAGVKPNDIAIIERTERDFQIREGAQVAANHWEAAGWYGHARGIDSPGRARMMAGIAPEFDREFGWLAPPILNVRTRLAMVADAKSGRMIARGYEQGRAATETLDLSWRISN